MALSVFSRRACFLYPQCSVKQGNYINFMLSRQATLCFKMTDRLFIQLSLSLLSVPLTTQLQISLESVRKSSVCSSFRLMFFSGNACFLHHPRINCQWYKFKNLAWGEPCFIFTVKWKQLDSNCLIYIHNDLMYWRHLTYIIHTLTKWIRKNLAEKYFSFTILYQYS